MLKMVEYCKRDVDLLEKVYLKLEGYAKSKTHRGVKVGNDRCSCSSCGADNYRVQQTKYNASGNQIKVLKCKSCHKYYQVSLKVYNDSQQEKRDAERRKKNNVKM
jgi:hypothetical protein